MISLSKVQLRRLLLPATLLILALLIFVFSHYPSESEIKLKEAEKNYVLGLNAQSLGEREMYFNQALNLYLQLQKNHNIAESNGKFNANLATLFHQLHARPEALLYSMRAEADMARFSKAHLLQLYVIFGVLAGFYASLNIWFPKRWLLFLTVVCALFSATFLSWALYERYFAPINGIVFQESFLKDAPKEDGAIISEVPTSLGALIHILNIEEEGQWLKVETETGTIGYIKTRHVRVV